VTAEGNKHAGRPVSAGESVLASQGGSIRAGASCARAQPIGAAMVLFNSERL